MKKTLRLKVVYIVVLCLTIMLMPGNVFSAPQKTASWLDEPVTLRFQDESLGKVLEKISKQTGIAILYDQDLANDKVIGNFKNVKASDAITRLFSDKNKSIQVSRTDKVVIVKTFGAKNFVWAGKRAVPDTNKELSADKVDLAEIRALQLKLYREFKEQISDDSEIIAGDKTRAQLRSLIQQQNEQFAEGLKNDNDVIATGKTRAQLREMVSKQNNEFTESLKADDQVLSGGKTRAELREIVQRQNKMFGDELSDNNQVIEGGLTRAELRKLVQSNMTAGNK